MSSSCNSRVKAYLNKILALGFGDEWLELRGCESVDQSGFGDNEQQDLSTSQNR